MRWLLPLLLTFSACGPAPEFEAPAADCPARSHPVDGGLCACDHGSTTFPDGGWKCSLPADNDA